MESLVFASGGVILAIILAVGYYLVHESKYAFDRKFDYGFRFALQPTEGEYEKDVSLDQNASIITANREGAEGVDEKEEVIPMPTLEQLAGVARFGTGTIPGGSEGDFYRDDWQPQQEPGESRKFRLYGFATSEYKGSEMVLAWTPDAAYQAKQTPFDLRLKLVQVPKGLVASPIDIDLKKQSQGQIKVPTYIAKADEDRTKGYIFEVTATPQKSVAGAVLAGAATTTWDPTSAYGKFGFIPLVLGTLLITCLAILLAAPFGIATAVFLSELAPARLREWLKPVIELLASVPTVVLGYFGLMLLAPNLQKTLGQALAIESGRALLTTSLIMAVLLIPTITSIAEDALKSVPNTFREGGEALGLTIHERLKQIILPAAKSGLIGALLLGFARAIGETMVVWMLSGGTPTMPSFGGLRDTLANLMRPVRGLPDTIAIEMGNVDFEGVHYGHLFLLGLSLFVITLSINLAGNKLARRASWRQ